MMVLFLLLIVIEQEYCLRRKVRNKQSNENQRYVIIHVKNIITFNMLPVGDFLNTFCFQHSSPTSM